jgi:hypothetical protein
MKWFNTDFGLCVGIALILASCSIGGALQNHGFCVNNCTTTINETK